MESCRMKLKRKYETTRRLKTQKCSSCHHCDGFLLRIWTFSHRCSKHKTYLPSERDHSCLNWSLLLFLKDFMIMKVFPSGRHALLHWHSQPKPSIKSNVSGFTTGVNIWVSDSYRRKNLLLRNPKFMFCSPFPLTSFSGVVNVTDLSVNDKTWKQIPTTLSRKHSSFTVWDTDVTCVIRKNHNNVKL